MKAQTVRAIQHHATTGTKLFLCSEGWRQEVLALLTIGKVESLSGCSCLLGRRCASLWPA